MKISFFKFGKGILIILMMIDMISLGFVIEDIVLRHQGMLTIYLLFQCIVCSITLIIGIAFIKPVLEKVHRSCIDFEKGKTLELEIHSNELKWFPELNSLIKKINEMIHREDRLLLSHKEAEYLALQNQINPHFLYNTLEAIRADALIGGMNSLAGAAEALSSFFRYTISGENLLSSVEDELLNIRNYFQIQHYRFGDDLKLEIVFIDNESEIRKLQMPKLTLQPIVENCVFHGLETKENKGTIRISFDQTEKFLFISVKDDGIGMSTKELQQLNASLIESPFQEKCDEEYSIPARGLSKQHNGIALKNVSQRIKLLFGNEYGVMIYSTLDIGTNVKNILPRQTAVIMPNMKKI